MMTRKYLWLVLCSAILLFAACQKAPVLTVTGPTNIELSADGSSGTITFTANRDWTISASDSWVSVSPSSGAATDGQVTVTVRCGANTTYEDRTATVTIRMDELTQTVSVRQPANLGIVLPTQSYNLESDARTIDVEVQANVQYTVSTSVNWIKQTGTKGLTSTKYIFSIEENTTYDSREGTITIKSLNSSVPDQVITVKQAQKDALIIKDKSFDMPYGGGEIEFKVEANVDFDVKPDVEWIHYLETKALNNSTVRLTVDENPTYNAREGKIEIKQKNGSLSHTITVKEAGRIAVTSITLDQTSLTLKPEETATLVATVKPDNATDKTVTWSSSDSKIATVDETGKVIAIEDGIATITARAGEKTAECKVIVCIPVTSVRLNRTSLKMKAGDIVTLVATVMPDNATDKKVTWTSSDASIASVDENGIVTAIKDGSATISVQAGDKSDVCVVNVMTPIYVGNAVDLGITITRKDGTGYKLLWADSNLGTDKPEGYGDYYAWGETETKDDYTWTTYKFWSSGESDDNVKFSKYDEQNYKGVLDPEDDVAHVKLGGKWRMPTTAELDVLRDKCEWTWTTKNGVNGCEVKSKANSNSIFLPAAGRLNGTDLDNAVPMPNGYYWSSSLNGNCPGPRGGYDIYFYHSGYLHFGWYWSYRFLGQSVRPVIEEEIEVASVELDKTVIALLVGDTAGLVATVMPDNATDKKVTWTSSDASIASVDENGIVTAIKDGSATIKAQVGEKSAECDVLVGSAPDGAVNLGIVMTREDGTKYALYWAKCNLGASTPSNYGDHYAWGETETKDDYSWETYKWANGARNKLTKYCPTEDYWDGVGSPDGKMVLDPDDDVAHVKLGGKWRMPTDAEWTALHEQCTWTWEIRSDGGVGYTVSSKVNLKSIFLPAAGYRSGTTLYNAGSYFDITGSFGYYWSSSLSNNAYNPFETAGEVYFYKDEYSMGFRSRSCGGSIRPVSE